MDDIIAKADQHANSYKRFDKEKFLRWYNEHDQDWKRRNADETIVRLQRLRRWDAKCLADYYRERKNYVETPPID